MAGWKEWNLGTELIEAWGINIGILKWYILEGSLTPHDGNLLPQALGPNQEFEWYERKSTYREGRYGFSPELVSSVGGWRSVNVLYSWYSGAEVEACERQHSLKDLRLDPAMVDWQDGEHVLLVCSILEPTLEDWILVGLRSYDRSKMQLHFADQQSFQQYGLSVKNLWFKLHEVEAFLKEHGFVIPPTKVRETRSVLNRPTPKIDRNKRLQALDRVKDECRDKAKKLWLTEKNRDTTIKDMAERLGHLVDGASGFKIETRANWIKNLCPNRSPGRRPGT